MRSRFSPAVQDAAREAARMAEERRLLLVQCEERRKTARGGWGALPASMISWAPAHVTCRAERVTVRGARDPDGATSEALNGVYCVTPQLSFGIPVYVKSSGTLLMKEVCREKRCRGALEGPRPLIKAAESASRIAAQRCL
jgi:hypothetical protein